MSVWGWGPRKSGRKTGQVRDGGGSEEADFPRGAHAILVTPFDARDHLDGESLQRVARFYEESGAKGVVVLAVMGEGAKLDEDERRAAIRDVVAAVDIPVTVGVSAPSAHLVRRRIDEALALGSHAVLLAPTLGMDGEGIAWLYREAGRTGAPIILQDHPASTGVMMPVALIGRILEAVDTVVAVKNEAPPSGVRTRQIIEAAGGRPLTVLGGLGGLSLLDELDEGAHGTMTGFAFPEVLTEMVGAYLAGDRARARALYEAFLPWLVFEATPSYGLAIRKEFLRLRGVIRDAALRGPAPPMDAALLERAGELEGAFRDLWERLHSA